MKVLQVNNLEKVDPARYIEGDLFLTEEKIGILHKGKIEPMVKQSDLKEYVKKKDVAKIVAAELKKVNSHD